MHVATGSGPGEQFRETLLSEVDAWLDDRVINAGTAQRILARYGLELPAALGRRESRSRLSTILAVLGAILFGLGAILFVASNWAAMTRGPKIVLLLGATVATYALAVLADTRGRRRTAAALVFAGTLVYAASVFLVGQIYHLNAADPLVPFAVALGALPVALVTGSRPSLFVTLAGSFLGYAFLLSRWGAWSYRPDPLSAIAFLLWGMALLAAGVPAAFATVTRPFATELRVVGATLVVAVLSVLGFKGVWELFGSSGAGGPGRPLEFLDSVLLAALATAFALAAASRAPERRAQLASAGVAVAVTVVVVALVLWHPFDDPMIYAIVVNVVIAATVLWWVMLGLAIGHESLVNLGLVLFAITTFARYFDLASTLFDRSLVFVGAGVLLLVVGFALERGRRQLLGMRVGLREVAHART